MFATIVTLTNVFEIDITLFVIWHNKIKCLISTQINGSSTYPGVLVNLPRMWGRLTHVEGCHIMYNTQNTTILVILVNAYVCN